MYAKFFKRVLDFVLSLLALVVFSPVFVVLTIVGAIKMKGNPFFTQPRPGKNEKIFRLIKFRTMTNEKDENGNLLPDEKRESRYGNALRQTSLDELPEMINILKGDMSFVGPRPLLVEYLPYYHEDEKHRHDIRPGLTGWAQVNGRNNISWEETFQYDLFYVAHVSFRLDLKILVKTFSKVLAHADIEDVSEKRAHDMLNIEREKEHVQGNRF